MNKTLTVKINHIKDILYFYDAGYKIIHTSKQIAQWYYIDNQFYYIYLYDKYFYCTISLDYIINYYIFNSVHHFVKYLKRNNKNIN